MYTTPRIALAMFIMAFVGVVRGLWGSKERHEPGPLPPLTPLPARTLPPPSCTSLGRRKGQGVLRGNATGTPLKPGPLS